MNYEEYLIKKYGRATISVEELIGEYPPEVKMSRRKIVECANSCTGDIPSFKRSGAKIYFTVKDVARWLDKSIKVAL